MASASSAPFPPSSRHAREAILVERIHQLSEQDFADIERVILRLDHDADETAAERRVDLRGPSRAG